MTMLELLVALVVLAVAMLHFGSSVGSTARLRAILRENAVAREAARATIETLRGTPFADVYATYNGRPDDDPGGAGTAPGPRFLVAGLDPLETAADGLHGEIQFPEFDAGAGAVELREDAVDDDLGMPRDLNGDSTIDGDDRANDYFILPVRVRIEWEGTSGPRVLDTCTLLCEFNLE